MENVRSICMKILKIKENEKLSRDLIKEKEAATRKIMRGYDNEEKAIDIAVDFLLSGDQHTISPEEALTLGMSYERQKRIREKYVNSRLSNRPESVTSESSKASSTPQPSIVSSINSSSSKKMRAGKIVKINSHYWMAGQSVRFKCQWLGKGELTEKLETVLDHKEALSAYINGSSISKRALTTLRERIPEIHDLIEAPRAITANQGWANNEWEDALME